MGGDPRRSDAIIGNNDNAAEQTTGRGKYISPCYCPGLSTYWSADEFCVRKQMEGHPRALDHATVDAVAVCWSTIDFLAESVTGVV